MLKEKFEITTDIIGHEGESKKQITVLNRFISLKDRGYTDEQDVKKLGLQGSKTLSTPVSDMHHEREELRDHAKYKKNQFLRAGANLLADLQIGATECCRWMSRPTVRDWSKLERTGRCLALCPRLVVRVQVQGRARDADGLQRCKLGKQCIGQTEHQRWSSRARVNRTPSHVTFSRVCPHSL